MLLLITCEGWDGKATEWEWAQLEVCVCVCVYLVCMHVRVSGDCVCEPQLCCPSAAGLSIRGKGGWGLWQREIPAWGKEECLRPRWKITKQLYCTWVKFESTATLLEYFHCVRLTTFFRGRCFIFQFWLSLLLNVKCIISLEIWCIAAV